MEAVPKYSLFARTTLQETKLTKLEQGSLLFWDYPSVTKAELLLKLHLGYLTALYLLLGNMFAPLMVAVSCQSQVKSLQS